MKDSWAGLTPRHLTQAAEFMEANPECDGRGTLVAIVDSGVDPGADGLQKTSDGKFKFLDFIDASQLGDVDCSEVRKLDGKRTVTGLTGRELKLPAEWKIPDDSVRLGILKGERIMTSGAVKRINKERQKQFEEAAVQLNAKLRTELEQFREKANGDAKKKDAGEKKDKAAADEGSELAVKNKLELDEMKLRLELLESTVKSHSLSDPLYDCVVFHDGDNWRAVVDSTDDGDLSKAPKPLTDYDKEVGRVGRLCDLSMVNYTVHIYNEGKTLSVFTAKNAHGTHVSGIVGACYKDDPDLNGVAPGCQMIGIKIGNNMERSSSLLRALRAVVYKKCDMVNMSYGEYSKTDIGGAFRKAAQELVEKHGILFTISAGNNGPNLTTGGATTPIPATFNIGALITPKIALTDLSQVDNPKMPTTVPFPWSSCGPNRNGAVGVAVMAPGGAITSVPQNLLTKAAYMNGTSMAAPNALGCLSVVVSALKAQGVKYTSQSIARALRLTAKTLPNAQPWLQGAGLIQVKSMVDELVRTAKEPSQIDNVVFNVTVEGMKGIYLRNEADFPASGTLKTSASVKVEFPEATKNPEIVEFEQRLRLKCDAPYVKHAAQILLAAANRNTFDFEIDTNHASLTPGAHFASIIAYDEKDPSRTVFDVPITICKPSTSSAAEEKEASIGRSASEVVSLPAGQPVRRFFQPPPGATSAAINFEALGPIENRYTLVFAAAYIHPHHSFNETSIEKWIGVEDERKETFTMPCHPGRAIEVVFMKNWRNAGDDSKVRFNVDFTCVTVSPSTVVVPAGHLTSTVEVTSHMLNTRIKPQARVSEFDRTIAPSTWAITPLDDRDRTLTEQPKFQLLLDYKISMNFATKVRPIWGLLYDALYECHFDGGFWQMFDSNGVFVAGEDTFNSKSVALKKADYTMKLQVIHPEVSTLEKLSKMPCVLRMKLASDVTLKVYPSQNSAAIESGAVGTKSLKQGSTQVFWLRAPTENPKNTKAGDVLRGFFTPGTESELAGSTCKNGAASASFPLLWGVGPPPSPKEAADDSAITKAAEPKDERTAEEKFRDYQIKMVDGMDDKMLEETGKTVLDELLKAHPDSIEVQLLQLRVLSKPKKKDADAVKKIGDITANIVAKIPTEEIAAYFGLPSLDSDVVDAIKKKQMEKLRTQLREAYDLRAKALFEVVSPHYSSTAASSEAPSGDEKKEGEEAVKEPLSDETKTAFQAAFADLLRWTPKAKRSSLARMNVVYEIGRGFPAKALKLLNEEIKNAVPAKKELHTLRLGLYERLGWSDLLLENERLAIVRQFTKIPLSYT